jgi:hypothetical protein
VYLTDKQIAIADAFNAIVTRYGPFELGDDANGCEYKDAEENKPNYGKCCCECAFYRSGGCAIVNGQVEAMGVCRFWVISDNALENSEYDTEEYESEGEQKPAEDQAEDQMEDEMKAVLSTAQRNKLPDGDFVIPEDRAFPVVDASDVRDAVSSWGRYRGKITFDVFKARLIALAKRKGLTGSLPTSWGDEKKSVDLDDLSIKSVSAEEDVYRGLGIVFGSVDLVGDKFTKNTYIGQERDFKGMPLYWDHSLETISDPIGSVTKSEIDDTGVWFEFQLNRRNKYIGRIKELIQSGAVGLSTGAAHHLTRRERGELKTWVPAELSITPQPAEYKTYIEKVSDAPQPEEQPESPSQRVILLLRGKR